MNTKTPTAGAKLRAALDAALARASEQLGRHLEFDEAERHVIEQAAPPDNSHHGKLYRLLLEREEAEARHCTPHPGSRRRLAALSAGGPVDVCAADLPAWARVGEVGHWWRRAIVTPAGAVTFWEDDGSMWLAENGLCTPAPVSTGESERRTVDRQH